MADTLERIYKLTVEGAAAEKQLQQIAASTAGVDKQFADFTNTVSTLGKTLLAGFSVHAVVESFKSIVESMGEIVDTSQKLGVGTDELQKLRYAASLSGVSAESLNQGLKKLSIGLADIDDKTSEAGQQLRSLGVTSKDTVETALEKVADQFQRASDGAQKTAIAVKAFGKAGNDMIPLLNEGSKAIKEFGDQFVRLGGLVDTNTLGLFKQFGDNLVRMETSSHATATQLASGLVPALTALTDAWIDTIKSGDTFKEAGRGLGEAIVFIADLFIRVWTTVKAFASGLGAAAAALVAFFSGNFRQAGNIVLEWMDDTEKAGAATDAMLKQLHERFDNYSTNGLPKATQAHKELNVAVKKSSDAFDEFHAKLMQDEILNEAATLAQKAYNEEKKKEAEAREASLKSLNAELDARQKEADIMNEAAIATAKYNEKIKKVTDDQITMTSVLKDNFDSFFKNLQGGSADAAEAFKRMAQSIVAQMLKLLAQWLVLKAFGIDLGWGTKSGAPQAPIDLSMPVAGTQQASGEPSVHALGASPIMMSGTGGQQTLSPLARAQGTSGGAPSVQVNVHNNAGAQVDVQSSEDGSRIDITIERVRRALAGDVRAGGTVFSKSLESAYALGRARNT
jgi:hypothetical protein